jgi:hypothetical protein
LRRRLGERDDEIQLRSLLVLCAIADGRLADAKDELDRIDGVGEVTAVFGQGGMRQVCHAELALASGDYPAGLRVHREAAVRMRAIELPGVVMTGLEPWVLFGDSVALSAHARYATGDDEAHGRTLFVACRASAVRVFGTSGPHFDYPAAGHLLFALGAWALLRRAGSAEVALRLLALADRFAYGRSNPTMSWERITPAAEQAAPGLLARLQQEYRECPLPGLQTEARRAAEELRG